MSFVSLGLAEWLSHQVEAIGFKEPTPVQKNCIPPIIKGKKKQSVVFVPRGWSNMIGYFSSHCRSGLFRMC